VLWGVAGFVRRVLIRAQELGADFSSVRMVMTTGEAASPAMRADFRRRMGELRCADTLVVNRYGSTEQGGTMIECTDGSGFHSAAPDQLFHEIVCDETGRRLPDGEAGMLAVTHLNRRGTVFLRYKVGDVGSLDHSPCPHCDRTSVRLSSTPVRTGDIVKIKGALVNLGNLKESLDAAREVDEYQIVVGRSLLDGQAAHTDRWQRPERQGLGGECGGQAGHRGDAGGRICGGCGHLRAQWLAQAQALRGSAQVVMGLSPFTLGVPRP